MFALLRALSFSASNDHHPAPASVSFPPFLPSDFPARHGLLHRGFSCRGEGHEDLSCPGQVRDFPLRLHVGSSCARLTTIPTNCVPPQLVQGRFHREPEPLRSSLASALLVLELSALKLCLLSRPQTSTSALAPFARRPFVPARPSPSSLYSASSPTLRLARSFSLYPFASANKPSSPESSRPLEDALLEADVAEPVASAAAPVPPPAAASGPYSLTPSEAPAPPPALSLDTIDPATIPMEIGDLNALGLGGWWPIGIIQQLLEAVHVWTGMPWCVFRF